MLDNHTFDTHIMIVQSAFNRNVTDLLFTGAANVLDAHKATYEHYIVPGAFEIPAAIQFAIKGMEYAKARRRFTGYIALGCLIRGETTHYDHVCESVFHGLTELTLRYTLALGNGMLTTETFEQARERASLAGGNNWGAQAANTCLEMIKHKSKFALFPRS